LEIYLYDRELFLRKRFYVERSREMSKVSNVGAYVCIYDARRRLLTPEQILTNFRYFIRFMLGGRSDGKGARWWRVCGSIEHDNSYSSTRPALVSA